jgi:hypothetical protein
MYQVLPDLPENAETVRMIWDTGKFWFLVLAGLASVLMLLWTSAAKFGRLDQTLRTLSRSVDKLSEKIDDSADHDARITAIEEWRKSVETWLRRSNGD